VIERAGHRGAWPRARAGGDRLRAVAGYARACAASLPIASNRGARAVSGQFRGRRKPVDGFLDIGAGDCTPQIIGGLWRGVCRGGLARGQSGAVTASRRAVLKRGDGRPCLAMRKPRNRGGDCGAVLEGRVTGSGRRESERLCYWCELALPVSAIALENVEAQAEATRALGLERLAP
jgi:hypothetical protein